MSKIIDFLTLKTAKARATVLVCGLPSLAIGLAAGFDGGFLAGLVYASAAFAILIFLVGVMTFGMKWVDDGN